MPEERLNHWMRLEEAREHLRKGTGKGIKVAVLDSGIETAHPGLEGLDLLDDLAVGESTLRIEVRNGNGLDLFGHGTAIARLIGDLAPEVQIGSFRVLGDRLKSRTLLIQAGAQHAINRGYHILNCSFGCSREDHVLFYKDWIDAAYLRGCHIVAACNNANVMQREWPGHFSSVLTVNLADTQDAEALFYQGGSLVEFSARGRELRVPWRDRSWKRVTGSSFAAAHVTGLLARLLSAAPNLPPLVAKSILRQLASKSNP